MLAAALDHMRDRLEAGARADLLDMARVVFVKGWTARVLRENGFKNLRALAEADPKALVPVLMLANPRRNQRSLAPGDAERYAAKILDKAEVIVSSAGKIFRKSFPAPGLVSSPLAIPLPVWCPAYVKMLINRTRYAN